MRQQYLRARQCHEAAGVCEREQLNETHLGCEPVRSFPPSTELVVAASFSTAYTMHAHKHTHARKHTHAHIHTHARAHGRTDARTHACTHTHEPNDRAGHMAQLRI